MDYAVIQNDLTNEEIHPGELIEKYHRLLDSDIEKFFSGKTLIPVGCPTTGETEIESSFTKMGFQYKRSRKLENIYLSPRPSHQDLMEFYRQSEARKFWYESIFKATENSRREKIFNSHHDWINATAIEHGFRKARRIAEIDPVLWSYHSIFTGSGTGDSYKLINPLFSPAWAPAIIPAEDIHATLTGQFDLICLFGSLNRAVDGRKLLQTAGAHLVKKGLCFVTDSLSSGFEIQSLGADSSVILPPEKLNIFSYEGLENLAKDCGFEILEFSTPGLLDVENTLSRLRTHKTAGNRFLQYMANHRYTADLVADLQNLLQVHKLGSMARLVLQKKA